VPFYGLARLWPREPTLNGVYAVDDSRRRQLLEAKLRALVRSVRPDLTAAVVDDDDAGRPRVPTGCAAAVTSDGDAWFLAGDEPIRALGPALVWFDRAQPSGIRNLVVDDGDAVATLARRVVAFRPERRPVLHAVVGSHLDVVVIADLAGAVAQSEPLLRFDREQFVARVPPAVRTPVEALLDALATVDALAIELDQSGLLTTVRGLEVARLFVGDEEAWFEVGVGRFDRYAGRELRGALPLDRRGPGPEIDLLRNAVATVLEHRRADAPEHQLRTLRAECWLRSQIVTDPTRAGFDAATKFTPAAPPVPVPDLVTRSIAPAVAVGEVVVCSTGIDLDLVPAAAHAWLQAAHALGGHPRLTLVVPERDDHAVHAVQLAALEPQLHARKVAISGDWR
jgi:hypothetical protein